MEVVPHAGTWIEIGAWHKQRKEDWCVVPHAGTWIEICRTKCYTLKSAVVPHAGTWIEIKRYITIVTPKMSSLTQGRGLKLLSFFCCCYIQQVVPHAGTWIEMTGTKLSCATYCSRPSRRDVD